MGQSFQITLRKFWNYQWRACGAIVWLVALHFIFCGTNVSAETIICEDWGQRVASPDNRYEIWLEPYLEFHPDNYGGGAALYFRKKGNSTVYPVWAHPHWLRAEWSPDSKWIWVDDSMHFDGHLVIFGLKDDKPVKVYETQHHLVPLDEFPHEFYYKVIKWLPRKDQVVIEVTDRVKYPSKQWRIIVPLRLP